MSFLGKVWDNVCNWANETKETYYIEQENMKNKTDSQLLDMAKSGSLARRKAALEELRNRGIIK